MDPNKLIDALRETDIYIEKIYLNGGCYKFYEFLKAIYPDALPYLTQKGDHIVTKISSEFYDITGSVKGIFVTLSEHEEEMCKSWSFSKRNWLSKNCPSCGEPIEN